MHAEKTTDMKKTVIALGVIFVLALLAFGALLVGTGPSDAPSEPVVVDIPDTFEK